MGLGRLMMAGLALLIVAGEPVLTAVVGVGDWATVTAGGSSWTFRA